MRMVHLLALLMRHEQRIGGHWLWLLCRGVLRIWRLLWNGRRRIRSVIHRLGHLARRLTVNWSSMLVVLW